MSGTEPSPLLCAERLTKRFGSGHTLVLAVSGIDLTVGAGEVLLIVGPSGAGKTTLLTMIGALLRPTEGRVVIDGRDVTALRPRELPRVRRDYVGFVFQTSNLLEALTAQENVEIALNVGGVSGAAAHERARELLVEAGLEDRLDFRVRDLSGGERQRVSIARALANRPRLLLADEPTANLDSHHGRDVMELLRRLAKQEGCGVVIVSHDDRLRRIADRVLTLEDGRITGLAGRGSEVTDVPGAAFLPGAGGDGQGQRGCLGNCQRVREPAGQGWNGEPEGLADHRRSRPAQPQPARLARAMQRGRHLLARGLGRVALLGVPRHARARRCEGTETVRPSL